MQRKHVSRFVRKRPLISGDQMSNRHHRQEGLTRCGRIRRQAA